MIDASEKPLRRASPISPQKEEEWPVLFPQRTTTPDTLRDMLQLPLAEPAQIVLEDQERYPLLRGSESVAASLQQQPRSKIHLTDKIHSKEVPAPNLGGKRVRVGPIEGQKNDDTKHATDQTLANSGSPKTQVKTTQGLSAGAAAVEKSSSEAKSIKEPRQTRTSSLRARISAGQVIRDSPNKVLGFTDFTVEKAPLSKASNEDLSAGASFRARSSSSFGISFAKKPSRESLGGNRAPAQFVAGSRRPTTRRPSSRNSLRGDSRAPSPAFLEPSRPAPPVPTADTTARRSSIPIARSAVPNAESKTNSPNLVNDTLTLSGNVEAEKSDNGVQATLESIQESPKSTFRSKRLSNNSAALGPTLKISSSANRLIMGKGDSNKENRPLTKKKSKDLFRAAVTNEYRIMTKGMVIESGLNKIPGRPLSSQGFLEYRSHDDPPSTTLKVKKVKSIDMISVPSTLEQKSELTAPAEGGNIKHSDRSVYENPFTGTAVDRDNRAKNSVEEEILGAEVSEEVSQAPIISSVKESAMPPGDAIPLVPVFLPQTLQEHVNKANGVFEVAEPARVDEVKARNEEYGHPINIDVQAAIDQNAPSTPQSKLQGDESPSSDSFPPRSSSRMKHPNYTVDGSVKKTSSVSAERAVAQTQQDNSVTQGVKVEVTNDGNSKSSNTGTRVPHPEMSSQTVLADVGRKRNSTARESNKSHASSSKGLMSNFRGLFHKRTSDASEVSIARSPVTKKSGKRTVVNAHGSPFPSMSNIHPVHRSTRASMNRTSDTTLRPASSGTIAASPGTPTLASPIPSDVSTTTTLAMQILDSVRRESSSPKKERLLELGKLMVDTITQARDAEKAMEEAKQAARKAEVAHALCKKSVSDVANIVKGWKGDLGR